MGNGTSRRYGDTLTVAIPMDADGFNILYKYHTGVGGYFVANNIFDRLVVLNIFDGGDIRPGLAKSWDVSPDGCTYSFFLRQNVRWHDGTPFTSEDVKYTYDTVIQNHYEGYPWLQDVAAIVTRGPHQVDITLSEPNAGFLAQLGIFTLTHILPRHLYEGTDWGSNPTNERPIGTGAFRFQEWRRGEDIILKANDDFYGGRPGIDYLIYKVIPVSTEHFEALERGEVGFSALYPDCSQIDHLQRVPGVAIMFDPGNDIDYLTFNLNESDQPWMDVHVRRAVAQAIDRQEYIQKVCPYAKEARGTYLSHSWAFNPAVQLPSYNPDAAEALLDKAGYPRKSDGVRLRTRLFYRSLFPELYSGEAAVLKDQLARVGVKVDVEELDTASWKVRVAQQRDFDLLLDDGDIGPDPDLLRLGMSSGQSRNYTGYSNEEVDQLFLQGRRAMNREDRRQAYWQLQEILGDELPRIGIIEHGAHMAYRDEFQGFSWMPDVKGTVPFWNCSKVWSTKGTRRKP